MTHQIMSGLSILSLHNLLLQNLSQLQQFYSTLNLTPVLDRPVMANDSLALLYSQALMATGNAVITLALLKTQLTKGGINGSS